jgi:hypothetical protein
MKLLEQASDHTIFSYLEMLIAKKKLTMQHGSFGIVLIPPSKKYVYRVWADDNGYDSWLTIMQKNQLNNCVPELFKKMKTITGNFLSGKITLKVIKLEYLYPLSNSNIRLLNNGIEIELPLGYVLDSMYRNISKFNKEKKILDEQFLEQYDDLCDIVSQLKKSGKGMADFRTGGNIMQRSNGEYVISDPLSSDTVDGTFLPSVRYRDDIRNPTISITLSKILRMKSDYARQEAIDNYKFTEDEIKQLMQSPTTPVPIYMQLLKKYPLIAKNYESAQSMDDVEAMLNSL